MPRPLPPRQAAQLADLKNQVRQLLDLADEDIVLVLPQPSAGGTPMPDCTEPGCPPVETVIAVLPPTGTTRRWTLHHPISEIIPDLLWLTLAEEPDSTEGEPE